MSWLHVYRPDLADEEPRILSFAFYAPLIRAERAMATLREARHRQESILPFKKLELRKMSLRLFDERFGR
jgi:hypothetical protein